MRHILIGGAAALMLAGCSQDISGLADTERFEGAPAPMMQSKSMAEADMAYAEDAAPVQRPGQPPADINADPTGGIQYIAYSYRMGWRLPVANVEPVMQGHINACESAGVSKCIVTNSSLNNQSEDYVSGNLNIRAVPAWIDEFMLGVDAQAEAAKGDITFRTKSAEDLTRAILDTDARLNAQETLRGRLEQLLERRNGNLADLLATERELARVNGDIDSIKSNLKAMRLRVSMSDLSINYETKQPAFTSTTANPLFSAFGDFFRNLSYALAAVVTAFAFGLPWMLLIGLFAWLWLKLIWPRLRGKKKKA